METKQQSPGPDTAGRIHDGIGWKASAKAERPLVDTGVRRSGPGRKPRACVECKKQKMKCELLPGDRKCKNCLRRSVECVFKRVITSEVVTDRHAGAHGEGYEAKIDSMRREIREMKHSLDALVGQTRRGSLPAPVPELRVQGEGISTPLDTISPAGTNLSAREDNMHMAMTRENSIEPEPNGETTANGEVRVEEPMGSLYEVTRLRNIRSNQAKMTRPLEETGEVNDFISRGVISEQEATELYRSFHISLNHYLWVGLEQTHSSFASVRKSSELLTATILTVTALHIPTSAETFDKCYKEFLSLISSSMFSRYHAIDDVRALCIAAFWLSEVSWKLSGHAIRIATELSLHQSFCKALEGDREHFLRARLWYMLYVCDHHFSIAYGRPPMIAESLQIREHELFLQSPFADALDRRILSQVALMQILTRVYDRFAERSPPHQDPAGAALGEGDFADLRSFNLAIDQWRTRWYARQEDNAYIGSFPPKGIILYSYFAKLQLNSLAVRGVSLLAGAGAGARGGGGGGGRGTGTGTGTGSRQQRRLSTERKEFANLAIGAAASILTLVLEEADMRRALVGTPLYVHMMIAFAAVFLMKVATRWNRALGLAVEPGDVSRLLGRLVRLLRGSVTSDRHLLHPIARGLEKMLANLDADAGGGKTTAAAAAAAHSTKKAAPNQHQHQQQQQLAPDDDDDSPNGPSPGHHDSLVAFGNLGYGGAPTPTAGLEEEEAGAPNADAVAWDAFPADSGAAAAAGVDGSAYMDELTVMNDSLIYEAFGNESANDVYNLLSNQFSY
ncbi:hypothetical protein F4780DRAFT_784319 [Xylariomycetidae sp. FL0641]|nr:hypothetical protein F4780DRAFT_784319 [Xylariomycetidae sp. FL0641]